MAVYATLQDLIDRFGNDAVLVASDRDRDGQMDTDAVSYTHLTLPTSDLV